MNLAILRVALVTNLLVTALCLSGAKADEPLFSGPQAGEPLPPFQAMDAFGEAGEIDVLETFGESPVLIIFVHQVTRPSIALTRLMMEFAATKAADGLESQLVFLTNDATETNAFLKRARHALPHGATPLISNDGIEGPGAYGLNRKMTLTILVADKQVVTANFALVQPSVQVDGPRIGHELVKALGGTAAPSLQEMGYRDPRMARSPAQRDSTQRNPTRTKNSPEQEAVYREKMGPVIRKNATPSEVATAAKAVEEYAAENPWFRERVHQASKLISEGPRLKNYGTAEAQEFLKKWAMEWMPKAGERKRTRRSDAADEPKEE